MLARLQKLIVVLAASLLLLVAGWCWRRGQPEFAVPGTMMMLAAFAVAYAAVLGVEFFLLSRVHGADPTPKATPVQLLRAWWAEVCAGPVVFCWRQPFCSRRWPDLLPLQRSASTKEVAPAPSKPEHRRGVLLVHGLVCNRGLWNVWLRRLHERGIPVVAVNLEPIFVSIDEHLPTIEAAVQVLHHHTGLAPVVVAHSMGGLVVRRWYGLQRGAERVHHIVTLGTPHQGTWLAKLGLAACVCQMRLGSDWLTALAAKEDPGRAQRFTCFFSHCDNIVFPPRQATLPGADNRHLPGVAHVHMVDSPEPWAELMDRLSGTPREPQSAVDWVREN